MAYLSWFCSRRNTMFFCTRVWLLIAVPYAIVRRREIEPWDWLMMAGTVMIILALAAPDTFFASGR